MSDYDISRSSVIAIFREAENEALKRHWGVPGSDGTGHFRVLCACRNGYSLESWSDHLRAVRNIAREVKPR